MHRVIRPTLGSTAVTSAMLLLMAMLFSYRTLDALRVPSQPGVPPVPSTLELMWQSEYWLGWYIRSLPFSAAWSVVVVVPVLLLTTQRATMTVRRRISYYVGVATLGGVGLVIHQLMIGNIPTHWSAPLVLGLGFTSGLFAISVAGWLLPPNKSLERTREG
jgi:hypothetical protein